MKVPLAMLTVKEPPAIFWMVPPAKVILGSDAMVPVVTVIEPPGKLGRVDIVPPCKEVIVPPTRFAIAPTFDMLPIFDTVPIPLTVPKPSRIFLDSFKPTRPVLRFSSIPISIFRISI